MTGTGKGDWHESLFKDQKGDSLGDGTWGKPTDDGKLAPVAWDKLPEAPDPNKKVRARLATPAPGSQKESGLLDIKTLAPSLSAGMAEEDEASFIRRLRQPTPPPADVRPARLATPAKGSAGSGLIDVQELVRMQEQKKEANKASDSVADAAIEAMNSSASISNNALPGANLNTSGPRPVQPLPDDLDDLDMKPDRGRSMVVVMLAILTVAVGGLAYYVLTSG